MWTFNIINFSTLSNGQVEADMHIFATSIYKCTKKFAITLLTDSHNQRTLLHSHVKFVEVY